MEDLVVLLGDVEPRAVPRLEPVGVPVVAPVERPEVARLRGAGGRGGGSTGEARIGGHLRKQGHPTGVREVAVDPGVL